MYGKVSVGFRVINEKATTGPQYWGTSLAGMYEPAQPMHISTLPGMTQMVTPLAKSTLMTQSSQMSVIPGTLPPVRDTLEPMSNEQARSSYLERQMRQMGSITKLPSDMPSLEDGMVQRPDIYKKEYRVFVGNARSKGKGSRNGNLIEWL